MRRTSTLTRSLGVLAALLAAAASASTPPALAGPPAATALAVLPSSYPAAGFLVAPAVTVRAWPDPHARAITVLDQFRSDFRQQVVLAVRAVRRGADGRPWFSIRLQLRPNGTMGWIPSWTVALSPVTDRILIERGRRRLLVYRGARLLFETKVAVGAPGRETPLGHFYVTARFVPDDPFLGVFAVETSAYSKLTEWPGGGKVGIHGTSEPQYLGQAVSHGCVRVSNAAALVLERLAPLGTPIDITA